MREISESPQTTISKRLHTTFLSPLLSLSFRLSVKKCVLVEWVSRCAAKRIQLKERLGSSYGERIRFAVAGRIPCSSVMPTVEAAIDRSRHHNPSFSS